MITALRAWGAGHVVLLVGAAVLLAETAGGDGLALPTLPERVDGWALVPALVALTVAEPLVDRSPDLTALATRSPASIGLARLSLAQAGAGLVAGYCLLSPSGATVAAYVLVAMAISTVSVAVLRAWFWVPLLPLSFVWLQHAAGVFPEGSATIPGPLVAGVVVASWLAALLSGAVRDVRQRRQ